jgi:N-acetylmuramoyl-L-alanine amidase
MRYAQGFTVSTGQNGVLIEITENENERSVWMIAYPEIKRPLKRILLDPGHSTKVPGAQSAKGAREEDLNLLQAEIIAKALMGKAKVDIYNPPDDVLQDIGNHSAGYDMFISLHHNSYDGYGDPGTEVLVSPTAKLESVQFADKLVKSISNALGSTNRGVKERNMAVLRTAEVICGGACVLVESFFLNPYGMETAKIRSTKAAEAIAATIESMLR